jgi:hypothetical protein
MINETYLVNCCNVGKLSTEYLWCIRGLVFSMQHISPPFGPFSDARDNVGCTIPVLELPCPEIQDASLYVSCSIVH